MKIPVLLIVGLVLISCNKETKKDKQRCVDVMDFITSETFEGLIYLCNGDPDVTLNIFINTVWNRNFTFTGDIVIHNNATLTINASNYNVIGNVRVRDGGKLVVNGNLNFGGAYQLELDQAASLEGNGGSLTNHWMGHWLGIKVHSGPAGRINLNNFVISDAFTGLFSADVVGSAWGFKNITMTSVTFKDNCSHINCSNWGAALVSWYFTSCTFNNCSFMNQTSYSNVAEGPVYFGAVRNISFDYCTFNSGKLDQLYGGLDMMWTKNVSVTNSTFEDGGVTGCSFRGDYEDVWIENNTFNMYYNATITYPTTTYTTVGISLSEDWNTGKNINITDNSFLSMEPYSAINSLYDPRTAGIVSGASGTASIEGVRIADNLFIYTDAGVDISNANGGVCEIDKNQFYYGRIAVTCGDGNSDLVIKCNEFYGNSYRCIEITGSGMNPHDGAYGYGNTFQQTHSGGTDIWNTSGPKWVYAFQNGTPWHEPWTHTNITFLTNWILLD